MKQMTAFEVNRLMEACQVLSECLGEDISYWIGKIALLESDERRQVLVESLKNHKEFYDLPLEERLIRDGFTEDEDGNLSKTIEL